MEYKPTIGLEIHVALKTATKMFCDCANDPIESHANHNVCPVCLGHPGTLPTINRRAVEAVIRVGLALGSTISTVTKFDRKNYFYPDLPKGYQISQYDKPLVSGGLLEGVRIRRIHLEEDVGRLQHTAGASLVDFNRASVPLMELVTEPDVKDGEHAVRFARHLQRILRYLEVSDADMEKGQMRIEPNVSLNMGTKVELKNINSFKAVGDGVAYEITRQTKALEEGEKLVQETRGWDEAKKRTVSQRSKEDAHDYRYFPEPDLPPFETVLFDVEELRRNLPELSEAKLVRFQKEFGLSESHAAVVVEQREVADFFEEAVSELATRDEATTSSVNKSTQQLLFNYLTSDLMGLLKESGTSFSDMKVSPERLAHLIDLIADGIIMSRQAKDILRIMVEDGSDPEEVVSRAGLQTISDEAQLEITVRTIVESNPAAVADYKNGKTTSVQFLIGKAMGQLKGKANPTVLKQMIEHMLDTF